MEENNQPRRPRRAPEEQTRNESLVYGKNPVTELLKSGSGVDTVLISESMAPAVAAYYTALAKEAGAAVKRVNPNKLRLMTGTESHQGVAAFASEIAYATVEDLLAAVEISSTLFLPLLKTAGIAVVTRIGADLCRDAGESAVASAVEMAGAMGALLAVLPLMQAAWEVLRSLL